MRGLDVGSTHSSSHHCDWLAFTFGPTLPDSLTQAQPSRFVADPYRVPLEDLFDFDASPSLTTTFGTEAPPANDCTPVP